MTALLLTLAMAHPGGAERLARIELTEGCGALVERGRVRAQMGQHPKALEDFAAARACDPEVADVDREAGTVRFAMGQPERALPLLWRHLEHLPGDARARVLLAEVLSASGQWRQADLQWSIALEPTGRSGWTPDHVLAWAETRELAHGFEAALQLMDRAIAHSPGSPAMEDRALELEVLLGYFDRALARIDARIRARPHQLASWITRGDILEASGHPDHAVAAWKQVAQRWDSLPARLKNSRTVELKRQAQARLSERGVL